MPPNVLLVVMDSVRARNTSLHGHVNDTTPALRDFAAKSTVYEQARAPSSWSLPSHTSILTGSHVAEHGLIGTDQKLSPGNTVFEELASGGYATGVFSENPLLTRVDVGLKDGFDTVQGPQNLLFPDAANPTEFVLTEGRREYISYLRHALTHEKPVKSLLNGAATKAAWTYPTLVPDRLRASSPASVYADGFLGWLEDRDGPWAACINFMDAHLPYEPAEKHDQWGGARLRKMQGSLDDQVWTFHGGDRPWWQLRALEALYDGTIRQIDAQVERLVSELEARGELDDTLVVVTADHGEGFGERSELRDVRVAGHGIGVDEVLLHVPLVVKYPGQSEGERVTIPASLVEFPDVVRAAVDGERYGFAPDGPVLASANDIMESTKENARGYVADLEPYTGETMASYAEEDGTVRKRTVWRDRAAEFTVVDAQTAFQSGETDSSVVVEAFERLPERGLTESAAGLGDADGDTRQRLEDLGYM